MEATARPQPSSLDEHSSRVLRGRIGAYRLHATHDPRETTANGRSAFLARFELEVDPDGVLSPEERARRATYARKAFFTQLALRSARKRRAKKTVAGSLPKIPATVAEDGDAASSA